LVTHRATGADKLSAETTVRYWFHVDEGEQVGEREMIG
jgi:hypothetical protein